MKFVIEKINIENFRCFERLETDLWDRTTVRGENESGKSCLASSILWVLSGKDIDGSSSFEIVPTGHYGEVSPSVTLECKIDDKPVTLKREYKAKFARDKSFKDYATVCYINGLEVGARKFQDYISQNICNEDVFKILSNPYTFVENPPKMQKELVWQAQRRLLMGMVECKPDAEISKESPEWSALEEPLARYDDANQYLAYLKQQTSATQKEVASFEAKMEQQQANMIRVELSMEECKSEEQKAMNRLAEIASEEQSAKRGKQKEKADAIRAEIEELTNKKDALESQYQRELRECEYEKQSVNSRAMKHKQEADAWVAKQAKYASAVEELKATKVQTVCPTCKRPLTAQSVSDAKREIVDRIKKGEAYIENARNKAQECLALYNEALNESVSEPVYPVEAQVIKEKIAKLWEDFYNVEEPDIAENHDEEKEKLNISIVTVRQMMYNIKQNEICLQKAKDLEAEHRKNNERMNELQMMTDMCKDFITYKCKQYEQQINSLFPTVRFQLFEQNKSNDDIREVCNLTFNGHKYEDLSASTKLVANIELVSAFQKYYNALVPLICDNMESCTAEIKTDAQVIAMYVREENCPVCGGKSGRRQPNGMWKCQKCGHEWAKKLEISEG